MCVYLGGLAEGGEYWRIRGGGGFAREVEKRVTGMGVGGLNMVACTGENPRRRRIVCAGSEGIKVKAAGTWV